MARAVDGSDGVPCREALLVRPVDGAGRIVVDADCPEARHHEREVVGLVDLALLHPLVVGVREVSRRAERDVVDRPAALRAPIPHHLGEVAVEDAAHVPDDVRQLHRSPLHARACMRSRSRIESPDGRFGMATRMASPSRSTG